MVASLKSPQRLEMSENMIMSPTLKIEIEPNPEITGNNKDKHR